MQNLRNTITAKTKENSHNPFLTNLKLQLNQMRKTLKQMYQKQNSAHLLAYAHELKVTLFTSTVNTAWKLQRCQFLLLSSSSFSPFHLSHLGMNPKQIVSHRHSNHLTPLTRISQILNSTKPLPGRKLRKC